MLKASLKVIFAAAILVWLVKSDKLEFNLIGQLLENAHWAILAYILLILNIILSGYRWLTLIETKSKRVKFKNIIPINFIGQFFSTFLPGAVTGDLLKLVYVRDIDKDLTKSFLLGTVLIDRIIGLIGLIFVAGISSIIFYSDLVSLSPKIKPLISFNIMLLVGALFFLVILFLRKSLKHKVIELIRILPYIGDKLADITKTFWAFGEDKGLILKAIGLSLVVHAMAITSFWSLIHVFASAHLNISQLFSMVPIGFISIAIPIAPSGAGVGHLVFEELFKLIGQAKGASFFNLYFLTMLTVNLVGVIPYIFWKKKHSIDEANEFEEAVSN